MRVPVTFPGYLALALLSPSTGQAAPPRASRVASSRNDLAEAGRVAAAQKDATRAAQAGSVATATSPTPRPLAPLTGAWMANPRPTLRWEPAGSNQTVVEVCADRACRRTVARLTSPGRTADVPAALEPGSYFWRVRNAASIEGTSRAPTTWQFRVGKRPHDHSRSIQSVSWDLNGDGFDDLAAVVSNGSAEEVRIALFYGSAGGLQSPGKTLEVPPEAHGYLKQLIAAGDLNGDGFGDLAIAAPNGGERRVSCRPEPVQDVTGRVFVYLGSSDGPRATPDWSAAGDRPGERLGSSLSGGADLDGDGYTDLVVGATGGPAPDLSCTLDNGPPPPVVEGRVLLYPGGPSSLSSSRPLLGGKSSDVGCPVQRAAVVGDLDGDGRADLFVSCDATEPAWAAVLLSARKAADGAALVPLDGEFRRWAAPSALGGDVNGDGHDDLLVVPWQGMGPILWYEKLETSSSVPPAQRVAPPKAPERQAVAGDFNGDGYTDLVVAIDGLVKRAYVYAGTPRGLAPRPATIAPPGDQLRFATAASTGDFNGDGYSDLVLGGVERGVGERFYVYSGGTKGLSNHPSLIVVPEPRGTTQQPHGGH